MPKFLIRSHEDLLKADEILKEFAISWAPIDEIEPVFFYFNGMDWKVTLDPIGPIARDCRSWRRIKVFLVISGCSNKIICSIFISLKNVDKKSKLSNLETRSLPKL